MARELRERIALGEFGDTGALESEAELARRYGVSRATVRRALHELRDQGLVASRKGAGWYLTGSFHQALAVGTFRHAASAVSEAGKTVERRVAEFGYLPLPPAVASALETTTDEDALFSRSVRCVDGLPLDLVHEWVPGAVAGRLSRDDAQGRGIWASLRREGRTVAYVRQRISAAVTTGADAGLLEVPAGTPLLVVRRVAHEPDGRPLALSDHRYLAHRFSLEMEFRGWPNTAAAEPPGLRAATDHTTDDRSSST